jgi:hypothetical protein
MPAKSSQYYNRVDAFSQETVLEWKRSIAGLSTMDGKPKIESV